MSLLIRADWWFQLSIKSQSKNIKRKICEVKIIHKFKLYTILSSLMKSTSHLCPTRPVQEVNHPCPSFSSISHL